MRKIILTLIFVLLNITITSANYTCNEEEILNYNYDYSNAILNIEMIDNKNLDIKYDLSNKTNQDLLNEMEENKHIASINYSKDEFLFFGKEYKLYEPYGGWEDFPFYILFSNDKKSASYMAFEYLENGDINYFVIKDGIKQKLYSDFSGFGNNIKYSSKDNSHFIIYYGINSNGKYLINLDGYELSSYQYDYIVSLNYFNNGNNIISVAQKNGNDFLLTCNLNNFSENTSTAYILSSNELQKIEKIGDVINKMGSYEKYKYDNLFNKYLSEFEKGSKNYEIVKQLLKTINNDSDGF